MDGLPGTDSRCRAISAAPPAGAGGDYQFLPGGPAPHPGAGVTGRGGVAHRPEPDRLVIADQPLIAQRQGMRLVRQPVQHLPLSGQPR